MADNYWTRRTTNLSRRRVLGGAAVAGLGVSGMALVGCGDDDDDPDGSATATGTASGTAVVGEPVRGGTLNVLLSGAAPHFDPHQDQTELTQGHNVGQIYSRLLKYKTGEDIVGTHIPVVDTAESWEQVDAQNFTFKLRPGVTFHDVAPVSGRTLTMDDVVFSYERQRALETNSIFLDDIETWTAVDDTTLQIKLKTPTADFLLHFAAAMNKIVAREVVEEYGDLKNNPVNIGTGPFMAKTMTPNGSEIVRNPNYFRPEAPYLDAVKYIVIPDRNTQLAAFSTGEIQYLSVDKRERDQLEGQVKDMRTLSYPGSTPYGLMVNTELEPMNDVRVRQALNHAINRRSLIDIAFVGDGTLTTSVQNVDRDRELPESELEQLLAYDEAKAKALLAEAGVRDWSPTMTNWHQVASVAAGELVNPMIRAAGINVTTQVTDDPKSVQTMMGNGLNMHFGAWPFFPSPTIDLRARWRTGGAWNGPKLSDADLDAMIDRYAVEADPEAATALLLDIQRKILTSLSYIPALRTVTHIVSRPEMHGVTWGPYLASENLPQQWLEKK